MSGGIRVYLPGASLRYAILLMSQICCMLLAGQSTGVQERAATPIVHVMATPASGSGHSREAMQSDEASNDTSAQTPWIQFIPAWQVVGTVLLVAFVVLLVGIIWLRWISPGGR